MDQGEEVIVFQLQGVVEHGNILIGLQQELHRTGIIAVVQIEEAFAAGDAGFQALLRKIPQELVSLVQIVGSGIQLLEVHIDPGDVDIGFGLLFGGATIFQ